MSRAIRQSILILGETVVLASLLFAQKTNTTFDEKFNFAEHKRYAWRENRLITRQNPDTNEVMDRKIVKAVNQLLASRGFVEATDKPDFYLYYDGGGDMHAAVGTEANANSTPLSPNDPSPTYGLGNGPSLAPSTWLKVNGEIVFYMVDPQAKKTVWETVYRKTFRDPQKALQNLDKEVNELVTKSFKEFPPKPSK